MSSSTVPSHITESMSDRKKSRELAEARASGAVAPQVDVKTGSMINPHNPEFITKRPWYLGGNDTGPSLDHQGDQRLDKDRIELSMTSADNVIKEERKKLKELSKKNKLQVGMWVEALKHNKGTYKICKIIKIAKKGTQYDLQYEDGTIERKVKFKPKDKKNRLMKPRIRITKTGTRSMEIDATIHGKETYDSKRDKYHGYDQEVHTKRIEKVFNERQAIRRQKRTSSHKDDDDHNKDNNTTNGDNNNNNNGKGGENNNDDNHHSDSDSDYDSDIGSDDSDDEFVQRDEDAKVITSRLARQGGVGGAQMKVTARNLRIREDTAKYLRNLDPNSAYYDPKSRSMRDNPNPEIPKEEAQFAGDNFTRVSGDAIQLADTQLFAWDATSKGVNEIHPQANPSQAELLKKKFKSKSADLKLQKKKAVLDKYGGAEYLDGNTGLAHAIDATSNDNDTTTTKKHKTDAEMEDEKYKRQEKLIQDRKIRFGVSTTVEEYSRDGRLLKGNNTKGIKRVALKSKYEEDIYINGHTTVWGSYFHIGAFSWGYADDHSLIKNSYCTGSNGRKVNDEANEMKYGTGIAGSAALAQARGMLKASKKSSKSSLSNSKDLLSQSKLYGEADLSNIELDKNKLKDAMKKVDETNKQSNDDRKRKYNSMNADIDVSQEEMEAYRLKKERSLDPMAKISTDEVLDYK